jgi:hypothetical protein
MKEMSTHAIYKILDVAVIGPNTLKIWFDDGMERVIDFSDILHGPIYAPLRDPQFFAQVRIDPETHTLVWPNGADFDPETLHNWPEYAATMKSMAQRWATRQKQAA